MSEELNSMENDPVLRITSAEVDTDPAVGARLDKAAQQSKIPLAQDAALTASLATVAQGDEMPPQLFAAIAAVLSFFNSVERSQPD